MWRFLLPASMLVGALVVLLAGALGDLKSLPDPATALQAWTRARIPDHPNTPAPDVARETKIQVEPTVSTVASPERQEQASELQKSIARQSQELASLRTSVDQARQELDGLQRQRRNEEAALAKLQSQERKTASTVSQPSPPKAEPAHPGPQVTPTQPDESAMRAALARAKAAGKSELSTTPPGAPTQPFNPAQTMQSPRGKPGQPPQSVMLQDARQLLAVGRTADARQVLMQAQAQSALQPVTPDRPDAAGNSMTASRIGDAIRWLDVGNTAGAMQAINMAMGNSIGAPPVWSGYSLPGAVGYDYGYRHQ